VSSHLCLGLHVISSLQALFCLKLSMHFSFLSHMPRQFHPDLTSYNIISNDNTVSETCYQFRHQKQTALFSVSTYFRTVSKLPSHTLQISKLYSRLVHCLCSCHTGIWSSCLMRKVNSDVGLIVWHRDAQLAWPTCSSSSSLHLKTQLSQPYHLTVCPFRDPRTSG
jgi:hypothetical protein